MIFSYIEKLRRKPVEVRKRYALIITSAITIMVVIIWLIFAYINSLGTRSTEEEESKTNSSKTMSNLFEQSNEFLDTVDQNPTYSDEKNNWTQKLLQFDDDSLLIDEKTSATSSFLDDVLISTSTENYN